MKFEDYRKLSIRTNKWLDSKQFDVAHMLIGMASEFNELITAVKNEDIANISEELADIGWYTANYMNIREIGDEEISLNKMDADNYVYPGNINDIIVNVSLLTDLAKKWVIYNKDIDRNLEIKYITKILQNLFAFEFQGRYIDFEQGLQNNIDKLKKRYPEKYSDDLAQNRDLKAERAAIEKGI